METTVDRALFVLASVVAAAITAMSLALIAHFGFGLSREEVRGAAMVAAAVIGALVAVDFFGKQLRNRQ